MIFVGAADSVGGEGGRAMFVGGRGGCHVGGEWGFEEEYEFILRPPTTCIPIWKRERREN